MEGKERKVRKNLKRNECGWILDALFCIVSMMSPNETVADTENVVERSKSKALKTRPTLFFYSPSFVSVALLRSSAAKIGVSVHIVKEKGLDAASKPVGSRDRRGIYAGTCCPGAIPV